MKYIELKDLRPGQELILAWKDNYTQKYCPFNVKVEKGEKIVFEDLDEPDEIISYIQFHHLKKGVDVMGNKIIEVVVFDFMDECEKWCETENEFNKKYNKY